MSAKVLRVPAPVDEAMDEYIRRYSERDLEGVIELCLVPFLAIREGVPIHMPDRDAVRDHFAAMIDTYRGTGVATWKRIENEVRELGEHSVFATVRWNALDSEGNLLRDTRTTYHLLATPDWWRFSVVHESLLGPTAPPCAGGELGVARRLLVQVHGPPDAATLGDLPVCRLGQRLRQRSRLVAERC